MSKAKDNNFEKFYKVMTSEKYKSDLMSDVVQPQLAIDILAEYLLGDDVYSSCKWPQENKNTLLVYEMLTKYSRKFRKEFKKRHNEKYKT